MHEMKYIDMISVENWTLNSESTVPQCVRVLVFFFLIISY